MKTRIIFLLAALTMSLTACIPTQNSNNSSGNSSEGQSSSSSESQKEPVETFWSGSYTNPLFVTNASGNYYANEIADPCVVRGDDGYVYAFATSGRVLRSEDGCEWTSYAENIIPRPSWGDAYAERPIIWAPDVVKIGDKWIYYYSLSAWGGPCGIGYATADAIGGPYTDQGMLFASEEIASKVGSDKSLGVSNAIDQQVIIDDDGSVYMVFGSFIGCFLVELTEDGMGLKNGIPYQREHKVLIAGEMPGGFDEYHYEGSWIFKKDDFWYYMGSTGSCCNGKTSTYRVMVGKADNIAGPYYDSEGQRLDEKYESTSGDLVVWSSPENEQTKGPGHNAVIVDDAGDYWWYGHCYYEYDNFTTRHLAMDKIEWDENDMPYLEEQELSYNEELDGPRWLEVER